MCLALFLWGAGLAHAEEGAPVELTFDESGKAYLYPADLVATGMTLDAETGVLTKDAEGAASLTVNLGDVDFSDVTRIDVSVDVSAENGYSDLISCTIVRSQTEDINAWYTSRYGINYADGDYQSRSGHIKEIVMAANDTVMGQMKLNSICITKDMSVEIPVEEGETSLAEIPYQVLTDGTWNPGTPDWNVGNGEQNTIYGRGSTVPTYYADLSEYDELRIYQTAGDPVRVFFFNDLSDSYMPGDQPESDYYLLVNTTTEPALVVGETYSSVDLKAIKEKFGFAKLIAIKASAFNTTATVDKIAVALSASGEEDPDAPVELTFDESGKAYVDLADLEVTGMTLDAETGLLAKDAEGAASLTIHLGDVDFSDVTRIDVSVDVSAENGYSDLISCTIVRSQTEDINAWYTSRYGINYADGDYQSRSGHIKEIVMAANDTVMGQMKLNSICITKDMSVEIPVEEGETSLAEIPYQVLTDGTWNPGTPDWNVGNGEQNTIYGRGSTVPTYYADLSEYDELRIYQTAGDPVRVFFFNDLSDSYMPGDQPESDYYLLVNTTTEPALVVGETYSSVDLKAIKEKFGFAKLIAIKASAFNTTATVGKIALVKSEDIGTSIGTAEKAAGDAATVEAIYDLSGRRVDAPVKGVNLVKMSDGRVKKVIVD